MSASVCARCGSAVRLVLDQADAEPCRVPVRPVSALAVRFGPGSARYQTHVVAGEHVYAVLADAADPPVRRVRRRRR